MKKNAEKIISVLEFIYPIKCFYEDPAKLKEKGNLKIQAAFLFRFKWSEL